MQGNALFQEFKGALTENFVAQELNLKHFKDIYYWTSKGTAEQGYNLRMISVVRPLAIARGRIH